MMHKCPHCQQPGLSSWTKVISVFFGPARCVQCKNLSYIPIYNALLTLGSWILLTWVFIGLSYLSQASIFLLGTIPAMIISYNKFLLQATMIKVKQS